jgi:hypothetical protein
MKRIAFLATMAFLLWSTPTLGGPQDPGDCGDGVGPEIDNCTEACNPIQDDTDADDCGNLCDADYDQDGRTGFSDFGLFATHFGQLDAELYQHTEPIGPDQVVSFADFGFFVTQFNVAVPGPSGTTAGTVACP